jgi:hypothetical protein
VRQFAGAFLAPATAKTRNDHKLFNVLKDGAGGLDGCCRIGFAGAEVHVLFDQAQSVILH